jgi:manganese transport protein
MTRIVRRLKNLGPGLLVAAAFIGPGTVTTASVAGAGYGYALLYTLVFAIVATIILQEMSARLGVVSRQGLGEAMRTTFGNPILKAVAALLVIAAIVVGNTAYQAGNIIGASLGLQTILGLSTRVWAIVIGIAAFALLASGIYALIERALIALVGVMAIVFLATAIIVLPNLGDLLAGAFVPNVPAGALLTVVALIGTTVVPYNLFLHASSVREKWSEDVPTDQALSESRVDTSISIVIGGLITSAVLVSAAAAFTLGTQISSAAAMAEQLEPLLGPAAKYFFALGLLAAGLTSTVTAPLAAAYATQGILGWEQNIRTWNFRAVWATVLIIGAVLAALGGSPVELIVFAQALNGILLPIVAIFLMVVMNRNDVLGEYTNGIVGNILGGLVTLLVTALGVYAVLNAFGVA